MNVLNINNKYMFLIFHPKMSLTVGRKHSKCLLLYVEVSLPLCVSLSTSLDVQRRELFTRKTWAQFPNTLQKNLHNFKNSGEFVSFQRQIKKINLLYLDQSVTDPANFWQRRLFCLCISAALLSGALLPPLMLKCK